jgi:hypothetical protein
MKPASTDYEILHWMENFGYNRKVIHAADAYEAITIYRKNLEDKYGPIDGKLLVVKVEEKTK